MVVLVHFAAHFPSPCTVFCWAKVLSLGGGSLSWIDRCGGPRPRPRRRTLGVHCNLTPLPPLPLSAAQGQAVGLIPKELGGRKEDGGGGSGESRVAYVLAALLRCTLQRFSPSFVNLFSARQKKNFLSKQALPNSSDKKHLSSQFLLPSLPLPRGPPRSNVNNTAERERRGSGEQLENILFRKPDLRRAEKERKEGRNSGRKVCGEKSVENNLVFLPPLRPLADSVQEFRLDWAFLPPFCLPPLAPAHRDRLRGDVQGPKKEGGRKGKETRQQHVAQISFPPFEADTFLFLDHKGPTFRPSLPPSHTSASAAAAAEEPACRICPVAAGKGGRFLF